MSCLDETGSRSYRERKEIEVNYLNYKCHTLNMFYKRRSLLETGIFLGKKASLIKTKVTVSKISHNLDL